MKKKKINRGGARPGAGRKKMKDPKIVQITFYARPSVVKANGGVKRCRLKCSDYLEAQALPKS